MPNYQNSKIYKIVDKNNLIYIGSTTQNLQERFWSHRKINNKCTTKRMDRDSLKIELILDFPCNSKKELWDKEKEYINKLQCINRIVPNQTRKEHYYKNYTSLSESDKKEYLEKRREKIICECGTSLYKLNISRHKRTKKHLEKVIV